MVNKQVASESIATASTYRCDACGFEADNYDKLREHEIENPHGLYSGSYPCKMCKKQVYVIPEDASVPKPDVDEKNLVKGIKFSQLKEETAKVTEADIQGGFGVCENCKAELRKRLG